MKGGDEEDLRLVELYAEVRREGLGVGEREGMWLSCFVPTSRTTLNDGSHTSLPPSLPLSGDGFNRRRDSRLRLWRGP